ncbi:MAG TPA: family 10 glycosylhydrolase [Pyrinomonadaceae bacterium]|nr:family 10 glycosylhydrolase [Pyrinomonadaceae bacterium]
MRKILRERRAASRNRAGSERPRAVRRPRFLARARAAGLLLLIIWPLVEIASGQEREPTSAPTTAARRRAETRALWVVRTTLVSPEKIRAMISRAAANKFNTIIVQVRGRGDAYYSSRWEPRPGNLKNQPTAFDPLAYTLAEAKRANLSVHAWINTNLLANLDDLPTEARHVYNAHPDWLAVPRPVAAELYSMSPADPRYRARIVEWSKANRAEIEGVYTGPANPAVREHVYSIWMDLLERYPQLDGLHFDYVRFASPDFDYSRTSLERFRRWLEPSISPAERRLLATALKSDPLAAADSYQEQFADFQREQVTSLVERIYHGVKKRKPDAVVSAAVFASEENARTRRFQDWRHWLALGILDVVCPMAYSADTAVFQKQIEVAAAAAHAAGRQIWAGIGAYRVPAESTVEKINAARALQADGIILFSYDFTIVPHGTLNPSGDYLERVRRAAFDAPAAQARP